MTIKINGTNTTAQPSITGADTDTGLVYGTDQVQVVTGGTTRATVNSSGNVGIGTSSPHQRLTVGAGSGPEAIVIQSGTGNTGELRFTDTGSSGYQGAIVYNHPSSFLEFMVNNSSRMRIDSSGNATLGYNGASLYFQNGFNNSTSRINNGGGSNNSNFKFLVRNSGSESEAMRIQSGGGISFNGDTAAANALDDYEEGTWTPVLTGSTSNPSYSGSQEGKYTKIGDMVTCWGFIDTNPVTSSGSGNIAIGGLPYSNSGLSTASSFGGHVAVYGPSFNGTLFSRIVTGASAITLFQVASNTALTAWTFSVSGWASGNAIYFQVSYKV